MKIVAVVAGGLGNQMQMTAALRTIRDRLGYDIEVVSGGAPVAGLEMRELFGYPAYGPRWRPEKGEFDGAVALGFGANRQSQERGWAGLKWLNDLSKQVVLTERSEVDVSMNACRDLGVAEADLRWHGELSWPRRYWEPTESFDVVIANNYYKGPKATPTHHWDVKGFPGITTLAAEIQKRWPELSICCIGLDDRERVEGVVDRTGLPLMDTLGLIGRARFIVTTDTMAFHAAACLRIPAFALWTATSAVKSACPKFHDKAVLIGRDDLACRETCFAKAHYWTRCKRWECQEIGIGHIMEIIEGERGALWN